MAGELDPGPRDVPSQELDAQPAALAPGRRRHRELDHLGARASGRSRSRSPASDTKEVKEAVDELVKLYVSKSGSFKTADGKSVVKSLSEVDEFVTKELRPDEKLLFLGERTIAGWAASAATPSPASRTPSRSAPRSTTGGSRAPPGSTTATSPNTSTTSLRTTAGVATAPTRIYQEKVTHETRMGFLFQKLHRPAKLRLPEEEREVQSRGTIGSGCPSSPGPTTRRRSRRS